MHGAVCRSSFTCLAAVPWLLACFPCLQGAELLVYLEGWSDQQGQAEAAQPSEQQSHEAGGALSAPPAGGAGAATQVDGGAAAAAAAGAGAAADPYGASFSFHPPEGFCQTGEPPCTAMALPGLQALRMSHALQPSLPAHAAMLPCSHCAPAAFPLSSCISHLLAAGWRALVRLASRAALVVTEDMPVPPDADWLQVGPFQLLGCLPDVLQTRRVLKQRGIAHHCAALGGCRRPDAPPPHAAGSYPLQALAADLPAAIPMAAVDTACVLPMRLVRKYHERAFSFRSATEAQRRQRLKLYSPPPAAPLGPAAVTPAQLQGLPPLPPQLGAPEQLGWQPLELAGVPALQLQQRLRQVLHACRGVDHSVPGVAHLPGGSAAGYARWEAFRK